MPGIVAVEMVGEDKSKGGILLPDLVQKKLRADWGTVVGLGERTSFRFGNKKVTSDPSSELAIGDVVGVLHDFGKCIECFGWEEAREGTETRFYGMNGGHGSFTEFSRYPYDKAIVCKHVMEEIKPVGKNILIRFRVQDSDNGVLLLREKSDPVADVVSVGGSVNDIAPGDEVVFHVNDAREIVGFSGYENTAIVSRDAVYAVRDKCKL